MINNNLGKIEEILNFEADQELRRIIDDIFQKVEYYYEKECSNHVSSLIHRLNVPLRTNCISSGNTFLSETRADFLLSQIKEAFFEHSKHHNRQERIRRFMDTIKDYEKNNGDMK